MSWIIPVLSGILEAIWATALGKSEGFSRLGPTLVFFPALAASMAGLAYAMKDLPVGTAYGVWVGIGTVPTVVYAMSTSARSQTARFAYRVVWSTRSRLMNHTFRRRIAAPVEG